MKRFKTKLLASAAGLMLAASASANTIDLTGLGYVEYGDALSYSLPVANLQFGYNTNNGPYAIDSTPGQIQDLVVVATGSEGMPVTTNYDGMDKAYSTPSGVSGDTYFYSNTATYRGTTGTINNNYDSTWDSSLTSFINFLAAEGGGATTIFFNNNQVDSGAQSNQSLAAWFRIWITDENGNLVGEAFELTNNGETLGDVGNPYDLVPNGGGEFLGNPLNYTATNSTAAFSDPDHYTGPDDTDFVLAGGSVCVVTGGSVVIPIPVACGTDPTSVGGDTITEVDHNLGADHAAYAVLVPELDALIAALIGSGNDLSGYTLHFDVRLGCDALDVQGAPLSNWMDCGVYNDWGTALNNGYEQVFIGTATIDQCPPWDPNYPTCEPPRTVPEPSVLMMFGTGLLMLTVYRRKQKHRMS